MLRCVIYYVRQQKLKTKGKCFMKMGHSVFYTSIVAFISIALAASAANAKPPSNPARTIMKCDGAEVSIYGYGVSSNTQRIQITFEVMEYLLTENSNQILNRKFFLPGRDLTEAAEILKNPELTASGDFDLDDIKNLGRLEELVSFAGIYTTTDIPVNGANYTGSLQQHPDGRQIRAVMNPSRTALRLSLFDTNTNMEAANWIFNDCRSVQ